MTIAGSVERLSAAQWSAWDHDCPGEGCWEVIASWSCLRIICRDKTRDAAWEKAASLAESVDIDYLRSRLDGERSGAAVVIHEAPPNGSLPVAKKYDQTQKAIAPLRRRSAGYN